MKPSQALTNHRTELQQLLGVSVSVLTPKFLSVRFRGKVLQQAQPL